MSASTVVDPGQLGFEARVRRRVLSSLKGRGRTFESFLASLEGADPAVAVKVLESLPPKDGAARSFISEARAPRAYAAPSQRIGHPLDYSWFFAVATRQALAERIREETAPGALVVYLGCPTLHELALAALPDRQHLLLDRDAVIVKRAGRLVGGSAREIDLEAERARVTGASMVIADPPWYPQPTAAFLDTASEAVVQGGTVLLSFAGLLTRPGIESEVAEIVTAASRAGLELDAVESRACAYEMPPFERAAFAAAGLPGVPPGWRRGDLYLFRRVAGGSAGPRSEAVNPGEDAWRPFEIEGVRFYTRGNAPAVGPSLVSSLVDGDVLPTVSRRDPRRALAALWTPCNRVFSSSDPPELQRMVAELACAGAARGDAEAASELAALAGLERAELGLGESDRRH